MLDQHNGRRDNREPAIENAPRRTYFRKQLFASCWLTPLQPLAAPGNARTGFGDLLDRLLAEVVAQREPVAEVLADNTRSTGAALLRETLQPRRNVDAVAVDLFALHHDIAEVDADAEFHPALGWQIRVLGLEGGLDVDRALDRIHDAGEFRQHAITGRVNEAPVMLLDERIDQLAVGRECA